MQNQPIFLKFYGTEHFLCQIFAILDDFSLNVLWNIEKSSNMPKIWQKIKKIVVQLPLLNPFFGSFRVVYPKFRFRVPNLPLDLYCTHFSIFGVLCRLEMTLKIFEYLFFSNHSDFPKCHKCKRSVLEQSANSRR